MCCFFVFLSTAATKVGEEKKKKKTMINYPENEAGAFTRSKINQNYALRYF